MKTCSHPFIPTKTVSNIRKQRLSNGFRNAVHCLMLSFKNLKANQNNKQVRKSIWVKINIIKHSLLLSYP